MPKNSPVKGTRRRKPGPKPRFIEQVEVGLTPRQLRVLEREADRRGLSRAALIREAINARFLTELVA